MGQALWIAGKVSTDGSVIFCDQRVNQNAGQYGGRAAYLYGRSSAPAFQPTLPPLVIGNQILPHLDQDMGKTFYCRVPVHGVVPERAVIGLVVADREARFGTQQRQERGNGAVVLVPEKADLPGACVVLPTRREGMDRNDEGRRPLSTATRSLARATVS